MSSIIIIYSTTDGHTREICSQLIKVIEQQGEQATMVEIDEVASIDLAAFDKIVIGASIRYGKHDKKVYRLIEKNQQLLESRANAFFSVNVVARKPEKRQPDTNPYLKKFLKEISWQPKNLAVFAGKIDYPMYSFWDRNIIRLIMWMTKGPTDPAATIDFTDWKQVDDFARFICDM
ncbi:MAG: menaquinone-dependent protoporphyrinogen IX dehydrogenase [Gammaproteobacteria bacterium]|nr:menaquinone-dependent protoporphyrinogen IX dehydrogenase [Gammaproteobacteria bacterium]NNJ49620.1 menaquinone-dependent protoporphyrinogen IX dehydrogenase [Gammaproteobacteria bacterium]